MPQIRELALTGIPRSGTTLACTIINRHPHALALAEPLDPNAWPIDFDAQLSVVRSEFIFLREHCLRTGRAPSRQRNGVIVDNFFYSVGTERRSYAADVAEVVIGKPLHRDFLLVIKQNAAFLALLQRLSEQMHVIAVVRHPLAVLASWLNVDLPVAHGRLPMAERMDSNLRATLDAENDVRNRQLHVLDWCYRRIGSLRGQVTVVSYESILASHGRALLAACGLPTDDLRTPPPDWLRAPAMAPSAQIEAFARSLQAMPDNAGWREFYGESDLRRYVERPGP